MNDDLAELFLDIAGDPLAAAAPAKRAKPKRKRADGRFVVVGLKLLIAAARASDNQMLLVFLYIVYRTRLTGCHTVEVTNAALAPWGVTRHTKYRALRRFERAGLITVGRSGKSSARVTLTAWP